ncbi:MAG: alpha/beta hydrolase, partial [Acidimicrobiia bacterium]|nr:alpha/beta hydrolase [Acidimicrobiia bacterium]
MTERLELSTTDGVTLQARWDSATAPRFTTVFCHPHPLQGGSMMAPLMIAVTQKLVERGHRVLRFNFRGTGESTGEHDDGEGELYDVSAAVAEARSRSDEIGIAGWSFGAAVALNWLTANN